MAACCACCAVSSALRSLIKHVTHCRATESLGLKLVPSNLFSHASHCSKSGVDLSWTGLKFPAICESDTIRCVDSRTCCAANGSSRNYQEVFCTTILLRYVGSLPLGFRLTSSDFFPRFHSKSSVFRESDGTHVFLFTHEADDCFHRRHSRLLWPGRNRGSHRVLDRNTV